MGQQTYSSIFVTPFNQDTFYLLSLSACFLPRLLQLNHRYNRANLYPKVLNHSASILPGDSMYRSIIQLHLVYAPITFSEIVHQKLMRNLSRILCSSCNNKISCSADGYTKSFNRHYLWLVIDKVNFKYNCIYLFTIYIMSQIILK